MLKYLNRRELVVAATCLLIGGALRVLTERRAPLDQETNTLGLLLKSCIEDSNYQEFVSNLETPPVRILGTSGTDFENVYPELNETYVANLKANERPGRGRVYYQVNYGMSDSVGRRKVQDFTVFLLDADDNSTLGVMYGSQRAPARNAAKATAE